MLILLLLFLFLFLFLFPFLFLFLLLRCPLSLSGEGAGAQGSLKAIVLITLIKDRISKGPTILDGRLKFAMTSLPSITFPVFKILHVFSF